MRSGGRATRTRRAAKGRARPARHRAPLRAAGRRGADRARGSRRSRRSGTDAALRPRGADAVERRSSQNSGRRSRLRETTASSARCASGGRIASGPTTSPMLSSRPTHFASSASRTRASAASAAASREGSRASLVDAEQALHDRVPAGHARRPRTQQLEVAAPLVALVAAAAAPARPTPRRPMATSTAASAGSISASDACAANRHGTARPRGLERDQAEPLVHGRIDDRGGVRVEPRLLRLADGRQVVHVRPPAPGAAARYAASSPRDEPCPTFAPASTSVPSQPRARSSASSLIAKSRFLWRKSLPMQSRNGPSGAAGRPALLRSRAPCRLTAIGTTRTRSRSTRPSRTASSRRVVAQEDDLVRQSRAPGASRGGTAASASNDAK